MADNTPSGDGPDPEINPEQAAEILGITLEHVRELVRNGVLPSGGDGDGLVVRVEDVEAFRRRRVRQLRAARIISESVNRSRDGWDS